MCFVNDDYDWYADVSDVSYTQADKPCHCIECGAAIAAGDWCEYVWQQEHEECRYADECCEDHDEDHKCEDGECDYGETYEARICVNCLKLLEAIWIVEEEEGCPEDARRPSYGGLWEEVFSYYVDNTAKYIAQWREMFPGHSHKFVDAYERQREE